MAAIETTALTKEYGDVRAVDGLSLTVEEGEIFGFLGPNGAGKSTTINVLLDYVRPTSGDVSVLGIDPRERPEEVRARLGVLPEGYALYDRLSARQHVRFAAQMEGVDVDPETVLDRVGLDAADADRAVGGFSKGMTQRLAFAMALVGEPDLLILDEPSSGLDPNGAREMRELVRAERDRGATVFFSSHVMEQVEAVCDRVGIMNDGDLVAVDTVEGLRDRLGSGSTLVVTVDAVPDTSGVQAIDGVTDVTVRGDVLRVSCTDPGVKADVIERVSAAGATVRDIDVEEASLEDLFTEYTNAGAGPESDASTGVSEA
ncbi:ATP-binding cassette domain-containing protein [Halosimplex aquaticum]|uniref:ATP-binding cassette domain-containing protein n=1 Tax=Halosimplex aquaticum TaxID=3026162 RepID=A0ABD5YCQ1_9EURY|nr:ABC transporter ATP-binding protein [Halosimplex aquaticum]